MHTIFCIPDLLSLMYANSQILEKEAEMNSLKEAAGLFEVSVPDFKQMKACSTLEITMLTMR